MSSLSDRQKTVELAPYIRRLQDITIPNNPVPDCNRAEQRFNRALPVLICPWVEEQPVTDQMTIAVTKDISDLGLGLIRESPLNVQEIVVAFWLDYGDMSEPWHFKATVNSNQQLGGGFWLVGTSLDEFLTQNYREVLKPLEMAADFLRPSFDEKQLQKEENG